jgi:hypothetical protein
MKYREEKLQELFQQHRYWVEKITDAFASKDSGTRTVCQFGLQSASEAVTQFKDALRARGLISPADNYTDTISMVEFTLSRLAPYVDSSETTDLEPRTARVFAFYLQAKLDELQKAAQQIDEEYAQMLLSFDDLAVGPDAGGGPS